MKEYIFIFYMACGVVEAFLVITSMLNGSIVNSGCVCVAVKNVCDCDINFCVPFRFIQHFSSRMMCIRAVIHVNSLFIIFPSLDSIFFYFFHFFFSVSFDTRFHSFYSSFGFVLVCRGIVVHGIHIVHSGICIVLDMTNV